MKKSFKFLAIGLICTLLTACSGSATGAESAAKSASTVKSGSVAKSGSTASLTASAASGTSSNTSASSEIKATKIDLSSVKGEGDRLDKILQAGVITCATSPDFAPSEFIDLSSGKTEYVGSDIELAKYIADSLGVKLEIKPMKFDAIKAAITTGQVDMAISSLARTPEREENMQLSDYFAMDDDNDGQGIVILKENADKLKTKDDFKGKTILAQNASIQFELAKAQLPDAECKAIADVNNGTMEVMLKKADGIAIDLGVAKMLLNAHKELAISDFQFTYEGQGNVIACTKGEEKLVNALNLVIKDVNEKNLYKVWKDNALKLAKSLGIEVH